MPVRHPIDGPCHLHLTLRSDGSRAIMEGGSPPGIRADAARGRGFLVVSGLALLAQPPRRLIAEYTATFGVTWRPVTRRKHAADFVRPIAWLEPNGLPVTTASLDFLVRVDYVGDLRVQPKVSGVWRGAPTDEPNERSLR